MARLRYTDRPSSPPAAIYCDANFVYDLFQASSPIRLKSYRNAARAADGYQFFVWARSKGSRFLLSLLCIEELYRSILFSEINEECRKRKVRDWKVLRGSDPAAFAKLMLRARGVASGLRRFLAGSGMEFITVGRAVVHDESYPAKRISRYAHAIIQLHELDAMDAFHIALARFCRVAWAATSDSDWKAVPTINLLCPA